MNEGAHVLIDLERTLGTGIAHFWKPNKMGYTQRHGEAGRYDEDDAKSVEFMDLDNNTVAVPVEKFENILRKYGEIE